MDRRSFLQTSLAFSALGLAGCQAQGNATPRVVGLQNSVPPQLINYFKRTIAKDRDTAPINYGQRSSLSEIFEQLQIWRQETLKKRPISQPWIRLPWQTYDSNSNPPDLMTLGDYWLGLAIKQDLIEPLNPTAWKHWKNVDPLWQKLVQRGNTGNLSEDGPIWAAPYRWGATVIAYRSDLFEQHGLKPPQDWQDLFQPELQGKFSLPDSPREVIGLALKHLGQPYTDPNTGQPTDLSQVKELTTTLENLHKQAKFYSSTAYLQPLILGHSWLAVGSSNDILRLLRTRSNIRVSLPQSGTTLWSDLWVRPKQPDNPPQRDYDRWIDAFWQDDFAAKEAIFSNAGSPLRSRNIAASQTQQRENPLLNVEASEWAKCEPLPPLDAAKIHQYDTLWRKIRSQGFA